MIDALQDFASSFPDFLQWLGVMIVAAVPFIDSYFGSVIGVLIGLPPALAIGAAVIGNVISMLVFVFTAHGARTKAIANRRRKDALVGAGVSGAGAPGAAASGAAGLDGSGPDRVAAPEESPRREKLRRAFDRYGVAGVSLIGPVILPSQFTSAAMVSFGANRNLVIFWQVISIVLWGVVFGVLATLGVSLAR